jgi:hypothetical protein
MKNINGLDIDMLNNKLSSIDEIRIALSIGWQKRAARKIQPMTLLKALCIGSLCSHPSFSAIAFIISTIINNTVSKQAVALRISSAWVDFCKKILAILISKTLTPYSQSNNMLLPFSRVLIQDSTNVHLPDNLVNAFPGSKNNSKIKIATAKIQAILDIKSHSFLYFFISGFRRNDQAASPDVLGVLKENDLVIRDLGYFALNVFQNIMSLNAFFLSRYFFRTSIFNQDGITKFNILKILRKYGSIDQMVLLGVKVKFPARLVALKVPKIVGDERRRKLLLNRDKRSIPTKEQLALLDWEIFITNVSQNVLNSEQIAETYSLRWRIEIIFKTWKSNFSISNFQHKISEYQANAIIYARLIYIIIFNVFIYKPLGSIVHNQYHNHLSILKLSNLFSKYHWLISWFTYNDDSDQLLIKLVSYFCSYEKRKRLSYGKIVARLALQSLT